MKDIYIAERPIGPEHGAYIIAEIGFNHGGDLVLAKKMIEVAAAAGADAVKFQTFKAAGLVLESSEHFGIIQAAEFGLDEHRELAAAAPQLAQAQHRQRPCEPSREPSGEPPWKPEWKPSEGDPSRVAAAAASLAHPHQRVAAVGAAAHLAHPHPWQHLAHPL